MGCGTQTCVMELGDEPLFTSWGHDLYIAGQYLWFLPITNQEILSGTEILLAVRFREALFCRKKMEAKKYRTVIPAPIINSFPETLV